MNLLFRWFVLTISVWAATGLVPGVECRNWQDLLIAALVLGVLNALVKPLLQLISMPFIILTLGLFLLVINALLLGLTARLVPGFQVSGFWPAVGGSLVISLVTLFLGTSEKPRRRVIFHQPPRHAQSRRAPPRSGPPPGKGPIIDV
jgi:putative membrane protein